MKTLATLLILALMLATSLAEHPQLSVAPLTRWMNTSSRPVAVGATA